MPCRPHLKAIPLITALLLASVVVVLVGTTIPALAQGFVYDFPTTTGDPVFPGGALTQGRDGNLYGTSAAVYSVASSGGVYRLTPGGAETGLHTFKSDGSEGTYCGTWPAAWGLTLGRDGNFYGTCAGGGTPSNSCGGDYGCGTVYSMAPDRTFTVLHSFLGGSEGNAPEGPLTEGADGNFYGTTSLGGVNSSGTVYKITPTGTLTTVHTFANDATGFAPEGPLFLSSDGNFYGATASGGSGGYGAVYKMSAKGKMTVLHNFTASTTDGGTPTGGVIQGADNSLYGATYFGGASNEGTLFKVTTAKKFTLLHSFNLAADYGIYPAQPVVQATDGNVYGVATSYAGGGYANNGTVYEMGTTKKGTFSVVFDFASGPGNQVPVPDSPLLTHTNGLMYGSTDEGGPNQSGTVYSVNQGRQQFVTIQTKTGKVGTSVNILGQGFTGTTNVSFNGTSASFAVVSDTFMTATIPTGATLGFVTVTTPGGVLKSNQKFKVKP